MASSRQEEEVEYFCLVTDGRQMSVCGFLSVCVSVCVSLSMGVSVCLSVCLSLGLWVSVFVPVCVFFFVSLCLCVCGGKKSDFRKMTPPPYN